MNRLLASALLLASFVAFAADSADPSIDDLLSVSGIKADLDRMPAQIAAQLFGNLPISVTETTKREIAKGYAEAFPDGLITTAVTHTLSAGRKAAKIQRLRSLVTTPASMKMTMLGAKEPNEKELRDFAATLKSKPPGKERAELLKGILDESHSVDLFSAIAATTTESIAVATSSGCSDDVKRIRSEFAKRRSAMRDGVAASQMFLMLYAYRTASDDELKEYLAAYRDPDARAFHAELAKVAAKEYLSRWKVFEKTLYRVGEDMSGRSMFAKSCRNVSLAKSTPVKSEAIDEVAMAPARSSLSGKDARDCLGFEASSKVASCAEKYR